MVFDGEKCPRRDNACLPHPAAELLPEAPSAADERRARILGIIYFALAALPLFGLGQRFLPEDERDDYLRGHLAKLTSVTQVDKDELRQELAEIRKRGTLRYLRPDGKSQVTVEYRNGKPARAHTLVVSTQHTDPEMESADVRRVIEPYVFAALPEPAPSEGFADRVIELSSPDAAELAPLSRTWDTLAHCILPVATLTYGSLAYLSRQVRAGLLEVAQSDFMRAALAKDFPGIGWIGLSDMNEARSFGITGTPGFLVNGRVISGAQPLEEFEAVFDELRAAYAGERREVAAAAYEPKMNVTPNAVAQKDD